MTTNTLEDECFSRLLTRLERLESFIAMDPSTAGVTTSAVPSATDGKGGPLLAGIASRASKLRLRVAQLDDFLQKSELSRQLLRVDKKLKELEMVHFVELLPPRDDSTAASPQQASAPAAPAKKDLSSGGATARSGGTDPAAQATLFADIQAKADHEGKVAALLQIDPQFIEGFRHEFKLVEEELQPYMSHPDLMKLIATSTYGVTTSSTSNSNNDNKDGKENDSSNGSSNTNLSDFIDLYNLNISNANRMTSLQSKLQSMYNHYGNVLTHVEDQCQQWHLLLKEWELRDF